MEKIKLETVEQMYDLFGENFLKETLSDIIDSMLENRTIRIVTSDKQREKIKKELIERLNNAETLFELDNVVGIYEEELQDLDHYYYEEGATCQFFYNCMNELDRRIMEKFGSNYDFKYCVGDMENVIYELGVHSEFDFDFYELIGDKLNQCKFNLDVIQ